MFVRKFEEPKIPHVAAAAHPIWKTLRLDLISSVTEYPEMLKIGKRKPSTEVPETFGQLPLREEEVDLPLYLVTVRELGFSLRGAHYDELKARAHELGYAVCPGDVPLQLARVYVDQPKNQQILVVAPQVMRKNAPYIYHLIHKPPGQRWIRLETAMPLAHFGPHTFFVFTLAQPA